MKRQRRDIGSSRLGGRIPLVSLIQMLAVAEHLSFHRAALALGTSQSSVSTRIKVLEQDLGVVLFDRNTRGVRLTEAGRHFIENVTIGIGHLDHAVKTAGASARGEEGRLRIGLHMPPMAGFLADLLARYHEQHPRIAIDVTEGRSTDIVTQVRDAQIDIAFVIGTLLADDCHSRLMWSESLMIALPAAHPLVEHAPLTWMDLTAETFLVRYGGTGPQALDHVTRRIAELGRHPRIVRWDVSRETLFQMVAHGWGVTITTESASSIPVSGVVFRSIADETERADFYTVWSPCNHSQVLRNLLDLAALMHREAER